MAYKDPLDPRARAARRKHYQANKQQYYDRNLARKQEMREWLREQKNRPCMDCGIKYPYYVMDFDHRDPSEKLGMVHRVLNNTQSWKALEAEVAKCDVVCANCHRERTYNEGERSW